MQFGANTVSHGGAMTAGDTSVAVVTQLTLG
jgi:hypothetical protein